MTDTNSDDSSEKLDVTTTFHVWNASTELAKEDTAIVHF